MSGEVTTEIGSLDEALNNLDEMEGSGFNCSKCEDGERRSAAEKEVKHKEQRNGHIPQKVVWTCPSCNRTIDSDSLVSYSSSS